MSTPASRDDVQMDLAAATQTSDQFLSRAGKLADVARGVARNIPPVPEDTFDLVHEFIFFEEERETFDVRVSEVIRGAGGVIALEALEATAADQFLPLPMAGR